MDGDTCLKYLINSFIPQSDRVKIKVGFLTNNTSVDNYDLDNIINKGYRDIFNVIFKRGDIDYWDIYLETACEKGDLYFVERCLNRVTEIFDYDPTYYRACIDGAIINNHLHVLCYLLLKTGYILTRKHLYEAKDASVSMFNFVLYTCDRFEIYKQAIKRGDTDTIDLLKPYI